MIRRLLLILFSALLLITISCTSTGDIDKTEDQLPQIQSSPLDFSSGRARLLLDTVPRSGTPRFFASTIRKSERADELPAALVQAAQQASRFIAVKAVSKFYTEKINTSMRHLSDLDVIWDTDLALEMIDKLRIIEQYQDTYGTYVIAELQNYPIAPVPYETRIDQDGVPGWIKENPVIPGYMVSVGVANRTAYIADSFTASDYQALEKLAKQVSVSIVSGQSSIENNAGSVTIQQNLEISEIVIPGFYILDRWRSPDKKTYYSLGIAPELR